MEPLYIRGLFFIPIVIQEFKLELIVICHEILRLCLLGALYGPGSLGRFGLGTLCSPCALGCPYRTLALCASGARGSSRAAMALGAADRARALCRALPLYTAGRTCACAAACRPLALYAAAPPCFRPGDALTGSGCRFLACRSRRPLGRSRPCRTGRLVLRTYRVHGRLLLAGISGSILSAQGLVLYFVKVRGIHHIPNLEDQESNACHRCHQ